MAQLVLHTERRSWWRIRSSASRGVLLFGFGDDSIIVGDESGNRIPSVRISWHRNHKEQNHWSDDQYWVYAKVGYQ